MFFIFYFLFFLLNCCSYPRRSLDIIVSFSSLRNIHEFYFDASMHYLMLAQLNNISQWTGIYLEHKHDSPINFI